MSEPRGPDLDDALVRARLERDEALSELAVTKRRLYGRLDRVGAAWEKATQQAEDRRQAILDLQRTNEALRTGIRRLNHQPVVRIVLATQRRLGNLRRPRGGLPQGGSPGTGDAPVAPLSPLRGGSAGSPTIAIHIASPNAGVGATWGDTPFALALQEAFRGRGWSATVHDQDGWTEPSAVDADVALHLLGLRVPAVRAGQLSLLWVISHPDRLTVPRCDSYDAVFVASESFGAELSERAATPVHTLLQATDPGRFHPDPTGPRHTLLFVGNARPGGRPMLKALAGTTHDLAVYGGRWTPDLLDPRHLRGEWIPNDELRRYYSSADIVLNDTWEDMRDEGFISNRVFDALACGAFVLSDRVVGMDAAFDGGVATYDRDDEITAIVDHALAHPNERHERARRGQAAVLERHTFDHRVDTIIGVIDGLRGR